MCRFSLSRQVMVKSHLSFAIAVVLICSLSSKILAGERPNILLIYTDDQSDRTVSCYEQAYDWVRTPNIDELAKSGVRFQHAYIGSWCMPSRATILTGLHQHGIETMRMEGRYPGSEYDPEKCRFWPSVLKKNGYTTAHIGKWHTGTDSGFGRDWDFQLVWNRPKFPKNAPNYYRDQLISRNGAQAKMVKGYSTDNYTKWAVDYINGKNQRQGKPWFLWLCYGAVHGPFTPADRHLDEYAEVKVAPPKDIFPPRKGKPEYSRAIEFWEQSKEGVPVERKVRENSPVGMKDVPGRSLKDWVRQYHQGVLAIDEGVGKIMKALEETGQDENTLVIFTSDQGFAWGQHGMKNKVAPYQAAVAAPLIIRPVPSVAKRVQGRVIKQPVSGVDIAPTILAQAKVKSEWEMHGYDLSDLLGADPDEWKHPAMLVHTGKIYGAQTDAIPSKENPALYHGPGIPWYVSFNQGQFKYVRYLVEGEIEELYDVKNDPNELVNLAQSHAYSKQLEKFRIATIDELKRTKAGFVENLPEVGTLTNGN